jgi:hypothetical protein
MTRQNFITLKSTPFWDVLLCSRAKFTDVSEETVASIFRLKSNQKSNKQEVTPNRVKTARRHNLHDSSLHDHACENLVLI